MELTYAELSSPGPVRPKNEDFVGFWQPDSIEEKRDRGALVVLADGVGGQGGGEIASRLAVEAAIRAFREAKAGTPPQQLLAQVFNAANLAVYDKGMENHGARRIATTLAIALLRNDQLTVGNVGDSRVYLLRRAEIKQISTDHSYVAMQRKLGLISDDDARRSENRNVLTRSVGQEPVIRVDYEEETVFKADRIVLCSDGLHGHVTDTEIADIVSRFPPAQACRQLVALAEKRGTEDNVSVQVVQVDAVEEVNYYRGVPVYREPAAPPPTGDLRPGDLLDDRFLILETISRSGMATIFKATDQTNKQTVAIKVPLMQFESDPGFYSRFTREEEIGLQLNHPFILKFIPIAHRSRPYIVTEYLRGYTLAHLLHSVSPLPVNDALKLAGRICEAVLHLHEHNIVHRDLKPQNIMICNDGTIRIMDFGIARAGGRRITFAGFTPSLGTPDYMAPEQVRGKRGDARTDIYSLGAILYELTTGRTPFEGESPLLVMNARLASDPPAPRTLRPDLPPAVEEIILHAMERDPGRRYATVAEMKTELDDPGRVVVTDRAGRLHTITPWKSKFRRHLPMLLAIVLPLVVILGFAWFVFSHVQR